MIEERCANRGKKKIDNISMEKWTAKRREGGELCGVGDNRSDRISNGCRLLDERKTFEMGDMDGGLRLRLRELERKRNGRMPTLLPFI